MNNTDCVGKIYAYLHDVIGNDNSEYHVSLLSIFHEVSIFINSWLLIVSPNASVLKLKWYYNFLFFFLSLEGIILDTFIGLHSLHPLIT